MRSSVTKDAFIICLLLGISSLLYAWNSDHDFHLDCAHGLVSNESIRSLDAIPSYFVDAKTLTALPQNADYRPILQITYALNYWVSEYDMWSYHWTHIFLHALNGFFLILLARLWMPHLLPNARSNLGFWLALWVGVLFVIHPMFTGVVNYQWARSSMLTTFFLLPALYCWMTGRYRWTWALYTLALFTKVEAVGALGALALWDVFQNAERRRVEQWQSKASFLKDVLSLFRWRSLRRWWVLILVTGVYAIVRDAVLPPWHEEMRSASHVTHLDYFLTQTTAWWHYVLEWWAPAHLIADDLSYPIYRSVVEPTVLLAILGWCAVATVCRIHYPDRPAYLIITLSALALISPTSSVMPLAEMVNEHRPYMPLGVLSILWVTTIGDLGDRWACRNRWSQVALLTLVWGSVGILMVLSVNRTQAFTTMEAYWKDVVDKAPSWRSQLNYGIALSDLNRLDEAEAQMMAALAEAPYDPFILVNVGLLKNRQAQYDAARHFFDRAVHSTVASETPNTVAYRYRAWFRLQHKEYQGALEDLRTIENAELRRGPLYQNIASANAGVGRWQAALEYTLKAVSAQPGRSREMVMTTVIPPFWGDTVQVDAGLLYFKALAARWPDVELVSENWVRLSERKAWLLSEHKEYARIVEVIRTIQHVPQSRNSSVYSRLAGAHAGLGQVDEALAHTLMALDLASEKQPVNVLAIVTPFWDSDAQRGAGLRFFEALYQQKGRVPLFDQNWAILAFNEALELMKSSDYDSALAHLSVAETFEGIAPESVYARCIEAHVGRGDVDAALKYTLKYRQGALPLTEKQTQRMVTPFWGSPRLGRLGLLYFKRLADEWPGQVWIHQYWSELADKLGYLDQAEAQAAIVKTLRNP